MLPTILTKPASPYGAGMEKNQANYAALSPLSFLAKAAAVYPERIALIHGERRISWADTYSRCRRLASALQRRGIGAGDTVAVMAPNIPATYEASFGVPMIGAVLNTLNIRLDAEAIAFQLAHSEARVLLTDREFSATIARALALLEHPPLVIDIDDALYRRRRTARPDRVRSLAAGRRPGFRLAAAARRVGRDHAELHVRHHRQSEGRRVSPSRRLPECGLEHRLLGHAAARGLPVDAADVSLQRLVLPVDHGGQRRHQCLPAAGRCGPHLRGDPQPSRDAHVRRADRLQHADQHAAGAGPGASRTRSAASSPARRRRPRPSKAWSASASTSPTCMA